MPIPGGDAVIPAFLCPSAGLPERVPEGGYFGLTSALRTAGHGSIHYKGSRGFCDRGMFWRTEEGLKIDTCAVDYNGDGVPDTIEKNAYTRVRIQDVQDGTTNTIAIGEAAYFVAAKDFPMWIGTAIEDGTMLFKTQDVINCNISGAKNFPLTAAEISRLPGTSRSDDCAFSWHNNGAFFGYVDGSVHFLTENLDLRIFYLLGDRLDNVPMPSID
jgi:hypothetical protein